MVTAVGLSVKNYILSIDKAIIKVLYVLLSQYYFLPSWINNVRGYEQPLLICRHQGPQDVELLGLYWIWTREVDLEASGVYAALESCGPRGQTWACSCLRSELSTE